MINLPTYFAACSSAGHSIFGFPTWYEYLPCNNGLPALEHLTDIWLIVAALIEILLRVAALAAVGYVIWGGVEYIMSRGEPEKTARAQGTVLNAVIGLVIAITSAAVIAFIAGKFK
jgi:hypothetical protein